MRGNLTYIQQKVTEYLNLDTGNKSSKGWIYGAKCPWCNQTDKFGIKLNSRSGEYKNHISFNCFHGSCQEKGSEFKLLNQLGKGHILKHGEFIGEKDKIESKIGNKIEDKIDSEVATVSLPLGFRRISTDQYLNDRGFEPWQFDAYHIGRTILYTPLVDYVLFSIREDGQHKGYIGRLTWSKQRCDAYELQTGNRVRKYNNEGGVDFGKLLFGFDELTENTEEVILVEGVTDKANIDKLLQLNLSDKIKCLCTFGKKISEDQIRKLLKKNIKNVTLLYDPDAIDESKRYSNELQLWDINVKVGYLPDKDPGELNYQELIEILSNTQSPNQFSNSKIQKRNLIK